jgi:hypothetical protein
MCVADVGHKSLGNFLESAPRHFGSLTSAHQGMLVSRNALTVITGFTIKFTVKTPSQIGQSH